MLRRSDGIGPEPGLRMLSVLILESITALGSGDTQSSGEPSDGNILTILSHYYISVLGRTEVIETVPVSITLIITGPF